MANQVCLAKLREGIEEWNKWRGGISALLREARIINLKEIDRRRLQELILRKKLDFSSFFGDSFSEREVLSLILECHQPDLARADLIRADLRGADLSNANLSNASLIKTNLRGADLSDADLRGANLSDTDLRGANLKGANLRGVDLKGANFRDVRIDETTTVIDKLRLVWEIVNQGASGRDLCGENLSGADLKGANLSEADLSEANLSEANLSKSDLSRSTLCNANLVSVIAIGTSLLNSNLTSATLTGACIQDWNINSATQLDGVICECIYLKCEWLNRKQKYFLFERRPSNPNTIFIPGEFVKLFQKALETVDLIFTDGINWNAFFHSFQELQSQYDDENLSIQAIERKSDGAFVVRLEVPPEADKAAIESRAKELYERDRKLLEEQHRAQLQAKDREIEIHKQQSSAILEIFKLQASRGINVEARAVISDQFNNDMRGANIANFANQLRESASQNASRFSQTISQNADEIARLIVALREQAQEFPDDQRDDALIGLDDLQQDLSAPEKREPNRIKRRIIALLTIIGVLGTIVATATDFANNVLELADKAGIPKSELLQYIPNHLLPPPNQP